MLQSKWNYILLINFLLIVISIVFLGQYYKTIKTVDYTLETQNNLSSLAINRMKVLISEKKNATLTIALSQSKNQTIKIAIKNKSNVQFFLKELSLQLRKETDFKNVWFQILDKNGISLARSWVAKKGDDLSKIRDDVASMILNPTIKTTISIGAFDLSFKAMVPIFSKSGEFIGIFEAITHFNSITNKISKDGFSTVILVDKKYTKQITHPFSKLFVNGHYVANKNADKKHLEMIALNSTKYYTSGSKNYIVDHKNNNIVVNYTLFSFDDLPMAKFLMFKSLDKLDTVKISNMLIFVNLFMLLSILIVIIIFLFLYNIEKKNDIYEDEKTKYILFFTFLLFFFSIIYYQFVSFNYKRSIDDYLKEHNAYIEKNYTLIYDKFKTLALTMYKLTINTPEVIGLVHDSYLSEESKNGSRSALYTLLIGKYEFLKEQDLRQLHFHLKNNESFLRFHRPTKYGDDLTNFRETVNWVNKNNQAIDGFEEGKIYNGFRHVFPLTYHDYKTGKEHHIGSVETSFNAYAIIKEFIKNNTMKAGFIIDSDVVSSKVFQEEKLNYSKSIFKSFFIQKEISEKLSHGTRCFEQTNISSEDRKIANMKIFKGKVFSILSMNKDSIYTFIPIKNSITKNVVASIILQVQSDKIHKKFEDFLFHFFIGISAIISILLFIYREFSTKIKLQSLTFKTKQILDTQDSIIVVTKNEKLTDVNKRFLIFFGINSKEEFLKDYDCVCDKFIQREHYFHTPIDGTLWTEALNKVDKKDRIILMMDSNGIEHSFSVSISEFVQDSFIVTFADITQTIQEQLQLKKKVLQDKLTGAYNREFFHENVNILIQSSISNNNKLALVLFDIDHFKDVNDIYGHNQGDIVLIELSKCVQNSMRKDDFFIRWGGEEFIVLFFVRSLEESGKMAEHLREKIEQLDFKELGKITCSFGAIVIDETKDIGTNIERADNALYKAKDTGRNKVVLA